MAFPDKYCRLERRPLTLEHRRGPRSRQIRFRSSIVCLRKPKRESRALLTCGRIFCFSQPFKNTNQNVPLGSQDQIQTGGTVLEGIDRELAVGNTWTLPSRSYSACERQLQDKKDAKEICFFANRADGYQEGRRSPVIVDDGEINLLCVGSRGGASARCRYRGVI